MRDPNPVTFRDLAPLPSSCGFEPEDEYELAYLAFALSQRRLPAQLGSPLFLQIEAPPPPPAAFATPK